MADALPGLPAVRLDAASVERVRRGQDVPAGSVTLQTGYARLLAPDGTLAAVAVPAAVPGALHPVVVVM